MTCSQKKHKKQDSDDDEDIVDHDDDDSENGDNSEVVKASAKKRGRKASDVSESKKRNVNQNDVDDDEEIGNGTDSSIDPGQLQQLKSIVAILMKNELSESFLYPVDKKYVYFAIHNLNSTYISSI